MFANNLGVFLKIRIDLKKPVYHRHSYMLSTRFSKACAIAAFVSLISAI